MKRIIVLFMMILLVGCEEQDKDMIYEFNLDSTFAHQLGKEVLDDQIELYAVDEGFGIRRLVDPSLDPLIDDLSSFLNENETTFYELSGYPDVLDDYILTGIITTDPQYSMYGYSVKQEENPLLMIDDLVGRGFSYNDTFSDSGLYEFCFDTVRFRVYIEGNVIIKLSVYLQSTNNEGVIF